MTNCGKIKCVILDWAGTTVDFGSMAPLKVFSEIFEQRGLRLEMDELRAPMGMPKLEHIRELLKMERPARLFREKYGRAPTDDDALGIYAAFEPALMNILHNFSEPIEGACAAVRELREAGIKIGSTTGYTREMMDVIEPLAKAAGYAPDCVVTPDEVAGGRPAPWMIFKNMERLGVYPPCAVVKAGDTAADIREGKNAGVISVGILKGSSELGLTASEFGALSAEEIEDRKQAARERFYLAGADYVLESITELPAFVKEIGKDERE